MEWRRLEEEVLISRLAGSRYISRVRGGAPIKPITMEICAFVKITNVMNLPMLMLICEEVWFLQRANYSLFLRKVL